MKKNAKPGTPAVKETLPKEQSAPVTPAPESKPFISESAFKKFFIFSLVAMLLTMWFTGYNIGFDRDELDMVKYGRANMAYYASGGKDTTCIGSHDTGALLDPMIRYYGTAFENIMIGVNKISGLDDGPKEFISRHIFNQFIGILALLFAGLIAHRLSGWRTAIFTIWLAFLSPSFSGHFYFNTKDVPFCCGYIASTYFLIRFLDELPAPTWKTATGFMLSLYFTINTRIGAMILLMYFGLFMAVWLFTNKALLQACIQNAKNIIIKIVYVVVTSIVLMVLTWPYLLMSPVKNLITTLGVAKKFPQKIFLIFEGVMTDSLQIPYYYLPKFLLMTTPLFIIALLLVSLALLVTRWKKFDLRIISLILFTILFPALFAILTKAPLYNGWRHFLFIYPAICVIAAVGLNELFNSITKPAIYIGALAVCLLAMAKPVIWAAQNMPYQYTYFNEIEGGLKTAYYGYDADYWMISGQKSVEWLMKHEPIAQSKDSIFIASNMTEPIEYYIRKNYPKAKVRVIPSGITTRSMLYWQYAVFNTIFMKPDYLENFYPLANTVYDEKIDGMTVTSVLKDTARLDWKAALALKVAKHVQADSLFEEHIRITKDNNVGLYAYMAVAKGSINKNDECIRLANKCLEYHLSTLVDYNCYCALGIGHANKKEWKIAIDNLQKAKSIMPKETAAVEILNQVLAAQKMYGGL